MIIPSIDLVDGRSVQLVGGKEMALDAGDPLAIARKWRLAGEIAVIDLDAALGRGSNATVIQQLIRIAPCRVGGGIRDLATAQAWLNAGATKIILGTAANPQLLSQLPRERTIAALDAFNGEVVVDGWCKGTGRTIVERIHELSGLVGGFLVTFVEREGRMQGIDLDESRRIREQVDGAELTVAGGVTAVEELAALDQCRIDAQVGMAIYTGRLHLADAIIAPLLIEAGARLWPTVVVDQQGVALGLAWSDRTSVRSAVDSLRGVYCSRTRGLWTKGATSGNEQELLRIDLDCDRDAIRFTVRQHGQGFCHRKTRTCWGGAHGLAELARRLAHRALNGDATSFTRQLLDDPGLLQAKIFEEAAELAAASIRGNVIWEAADLFYFALVKMIRAGVDLDEVEAELDRRALQVTRRSRSAEPDDTKEPSCCA